ncbi:MAG: glycosyltransferase family 10 [Cyanobacteria bacterium J06639_16]
MDKKTIGMVSWYRGLKQCDWLWKQTPHPFGVWGNIQLIAPAPKPDFLLMYQYQFPTPAKRKVPNWVPRLGRKARGSDQVPAKVFRDVPRERVIFQMREPPLEELISKYTLQYQLADRHCGYVTGPDDVAPVPGYMPAIWYVDTSFRDLDQGPVPEKTKACSWVTSGVNRTENHRKRLAFLRQTKEICPNIDIYGRGLPDWAQGVGELQNKWHAMSPYHYNLAIENYADNAWYVSEKLWDSLLSWCLPIYYGGPAADKLLPPESYLRLPSMDEKGLAYVQDVISSPDAWYERKDAIAEARQIILHKLNLLNWLSDYVAEFEA